MTIFHFVSMYFLMFSMVSKSSDIYLNLNQIYMTAIMALPMTVFSVLTMYSMYKNKSMAITIAILSTVAFAIFFWTLRMQFGIRDRELIRSMIPHHSGAILMCEKAQLSDPELKELCTSISANQQSEINQMKRILERIGRKQISVP